MEYLLGNLGLQPPLWVVLIISLLSLLSMILTALWLIRLALKPAEAANNLLTRVVRM